MLFAVTLSSRDLGLWAAFGVYAFIIVVYGVIYYFVYAADPSRFSFTSDIRRTRTTSFKSEASVMLARYRRILSTLSEVIKHLDRSQPGVRWVDNNHKECVQTLSLKSGGSMELNCSLHERALDAASFGDMHKTMVSEVVYAVALKDSRGEPFFESDAEGYPLTRTVSISAYGPGYSRNLGAEPDPSSLIPAGRGVLDELVNKLATSLGLQEQSLNSRLATADSDFPHVWHFVDFLYFSTVTQSTVGYGDILPNSSLVRMIVVSQIGLGYFILVVVINMILSGQPTP